MPCLWDPPQGVGKARQWFQSARDPGGTWQPGDWFLQSWGRELSPCHKPGQMSCQTRRVLPGKFSDGNTNHAGEQREGWGGGVFWEGQICVWTRFLWFLPLGCRWEDFVIVSEVLQMTFCLGLVVSWSLITKCGVKYGRAAGRKRHTSHLSHLQCHFFVNVCK